MLNEDENEEKIVESNFGEVLTTHMDSAVDDIDAFSDVFDLLNSTQSGELSLSELKRAMNLLGELVTEEELKEMLHVASNKRDFMRLMNAQNEVFTSYLGIHSNGGPPHDPYAQKTRIKVQRKTKKEKESYDSVKVETVLEKKEAKTSSHNSTC
eukprot:g5247.t1